MANASNVFHVGRWCFGSITVSNKHFTKLASQLARTPQNADQLEADLPFPSNQLPSSVNAK
jgi:hypothetical protein